MALVTIIARDVAPRFHGFLASTMLEVAPNIFISPRMSPAVRSRIWQVMCDWHAASPVGSLVIMWRDVREVGGVGLAYLGEPVRKLVEQDGMWLTRRIRQHTAL